MNISYSRLFAIETLNWLFQGLLFVYMTSHPPRLERDESEKFFLDPSNGKRHAFPSVHEPASVQLSVIVPSYNEEQRREHRFHLLDFNFVVRGFGQDFELKTFLFLSVPVMMDETVEFLEARRVRKF